MDEFENAAVLRILNLLAYSQIRGRTVTLVWTVTYNMYLNEKTVLLLKLLSQTQKNVSEPQTGIEPATF